MKINTSNLVILVFICLSMFFSCEKKDTNLTYLIEGNYYTKYTIDEKAVYGFIKLDKGKYYNNYGLYYDIDKKNVYREPYQSEVYNYVIKDKYLIVHDPSESHEVDKIKLFKTIRIQKDMSFKIIVKRDSVVLKNVDANIIYKKIE